ncbi:4-alpha-glucanotransferase [uncultured Nocardioides sp.]|uniref:4-alpha-glucanotransferase n=1 Tax=uncultured Nocardioides sp. TaxID=198441 RepID=UPI00261DB170|nr:4-alpha-glucanotransferase [uncultured Nocardioides sp.]
MTEYVDWRGRPVQVAAATIESVLSALGVDASDPERARRHQANEPWLRMLPPTVVTVAGETRWVPVHVPHGDPVEVWVELEDGSARRADQVDHWVEPREIDGSRIGEATFEVPGELPLGYHTLRARSGDTEAAAHLVVTPAWLGLPERADAQRQWGFATQLYSLRSAGSWGIGDLTDLTDLAVWSGSRLGADYVLVNPLHAAEPLAPLEPSPYLPSSRRFFNPIYLRVERIPEYAALPQPERDAVDRLVAELAPWLTPQDQVDRNAAWTAKRAALHIVYAAPRSAGRELDLAAFREREGVALTDFATWNVLAEDHGNDAREWPDRYRRPDAPAVAAFAAEHTDRVDFECWLQWVLDEQLQQAQSKATGAGMRLGIMHDLAVGVHPGGADAWRLPDVYAQGVQVGAPPDPYNQLGQDWSQPPWRPDRLAELGYAPFRDLIGAVLRHAGGVRVDHILGLFRLWWIPVGGPPDQGTYVRYDHEAMIGVLALEAHRAGAVVVGEDLGVVPPETRDFLASRGVLGTSVLWFEQEDGQPAPAEHWREWSLASVTTHDFPPTAGYLVGDQVRLQHRLGLLQGDLDAELAAAREQVDAWLDEVRRRRLLSDTADSPYAADPEEVVRALHAYLTLTPARLLCVALTDAVGDRRTQNQPGTTDEYPNWRVPLAGPDGAPLPLEEVFTSARARRLAATLSPPPP